MNITKSVSNDCVDFWKLFGGEMYEIDENGEEKFRSDTGLIVFTFQKLISFVTIIVYVCLFIRAKMKCGSYRKLLNDLKTNSVFQFMNDIKMEPVIERKSLKGKQSKKNKKEADHFICDFHQCCCVCCHDVWLSFYEQYIVSNIEILERKFDSFLIKKGPYIFFYLCSLLPFINIPLSLISPFFFANSCFGKSELIRKLYIVLDLFFGTIQFFNYVFIISFLGTKGELMSIKEKAKNQRGLIIYYHCKKALFFAFIHFLIKIITILFFGENIYELSSGTLTDVFWLMKCLFLTFFSAYSHAREIILISNDDLVIKSQQRLFAYQNSLLKYLPDSQGIIIILRKFFSYRENRELLVNEVLIRERLKNEVRKVVKKHCMNTELNMNQELKVVEMQTFKNIQTNNGSNPYYPNALLHYILFVDLPLYLICNIFALFWSTLNISYWMSLVMYSLESILFPWLSFTSLKRNVLFGNEEEDLLLKNVEVQLA